ncbi:hypothetical protein AB835_12785 [Candidatus Endobugula sertula]|uniref:Uncharacterized protein n=1 Tax=Candidatus Endobugula sertula TaxID=62101 RepID=A0A1D2QM96_9GAMM|nr:hypothetical protein AB835_12785 [Candidatus Endobugula sertula]
MEEEGASIIYIKNFLITFLMISFSFSVKAGRGDSNFYVAFKSCRIDFPSTVEKVAERDFLTAYRFSDPNVFLTITKYISPAGSSNETQILKSYMVNDLTVEHYKLEKPVFVVHDGVKKVVINSANDSFVNELVSSCY